MAADSPSAEQRFAALEERGLALDMTRGKPCAEQLDLSRALLSLPGDEFRAADGTDCRNYGGLDGLPEGKRLLADMLEVEPETVVVGDNSSLSLMFDTLSEAMRRGVPGSARPWSREPRPVVLCPVPGYDRHFALADFLGLATEAVAMTAEGPDMEAVARRVADDAAVKAIFCVPRYSNPTGVTFSSEVVRAFAELEPAAPDFRIIWDNAYCVHHLFDAPDPLADLLAACRAAGCPDRAITFASTSKVTLAGAGICGLAASAANREWFLAGRGKRTIGPDKLNQLRHARLLPDRDALASHMRRHADILRPKFEAVDEILTRELDGTGLARWSRPRGGYFIDLDVPAGCAAAVVAKAGSCGVKLTPAGA
ncbi:MAG: aminotransferase class I/II-fold pyridoxal phosphate-dependent enzyme, partial [Thermoanaerobaculia bacterium]|nr:aminotransferase class I/II-fold pyridoxal phosphate-dependent enzyme [Thermoanaerobaculia bacterium]